MGDLASMQAVTRVNAEQASKRVMRLLTWLRFRESRSFPERMSEASGGNRRGSGDGMYARGDRAQHGKPHR